MADRNKNIHLSDNKIKNLNHEQKDKYVIDSKKNQAQ